MTGYGRGEVDHAGAKFCVEVNSVNRKQSDIVINLPRDLAELEARVRKTINEKISRGRLNVVITYQESGAASTRRVTLDTALAKSYLEAMRTLQSDLNAGGEISIATILEAPGVMHFSERNIDSEEVWPPLERALHEALDELVRMREREGKHLAKDLIHRLKLLRAEIKEVRVLHPDVVTKYRRALFERLEKSGLPLPLEDERVLKEISLFADRADISEELSRLESHLAQFAHLLRKNEPVGRTLDFITQEISRELNTLGAKSNDAKISQRVVACKAELERIREQIQNLE